MRLPTIRGIIDRRLLVNFRIDPAVAAGILPSPFRPKLMNGYAVGGICLIRLEHIRPAGLPAWLGIGSENAAHRFAVEWDRDGQLYEGVYIPRRDTSSRLNALVGGRLFPGEHHHARYEVVETPRSLRVQFTSDDWLAHAAVSGVVVDQLPSDSLFSSLDQASRFFEAGSVGYSATRDAARFDGLELRCQQWQVRPVRVNSVQSSYFDDQRLFPLGAVAFDCALLMREIEHTWHSRDTLSCT